MLRFEMDIAAADMRRRTIEGLAVPYGEVAEIEGRRYRFLPGSVELARTRTPLLVDHDRRGPVGVLAALERTEAGELARFRVDATAEGDTALVQAASGSRGALSVGAVVDDAVERDGIVEVSAARAVEFSLVALGAFEAAQVTQVAASQAQTFSDYVTGEATEDPPEPAEPAEPEPAEPAEPEPAEPAEPEPAEPNPDQTALPTDDPAPAEPPPAESEQEEPTMEAHRIEAAAPPVIRTNAPGAPLELNAGELVGLMIRAQHGEREAVRYLEAALTESISTDVTGLLPPQYERTVIGGKPTPRPLYTTFRSRPLPGVGLAVNKPKWTTRPDGAWAATVDDDAHSTKVVIGSQAATVQRWDWAGAIPWVVVQRSDPSIVDEIYAEAVEDFYLDVETKIATLMAAAATNAAASLGAAVAAFFTANARSPEAVIVAPDVWGKLADRGALQQPVAGTSVSVDSAGLSATWGGLPIIASGSLAATLAYLVTRRAIDARVTEPVRLTANAIGALNVELAVVGEGLFDTDYGAEIVEFAPTIPAPTGLEATAAKGSKG